MTEFEIAWRDELAAMRRMDEQDQQAEINTVMAQDDEGEDDE